MPKATASPKRRTRPKPLQVVKGGAIPLTATQRELVGIFVEYLRGIPPNAGLEWQTNFGLDPLLEIVKRHFMMAYPYWEPNKNGTNIEALSQRARARYERLLSQAHSPVDTRQAKERAERRVLDMHDAWLGTLEIAARDLGVSLEELLRPRVKPATPLEAIAAAAYAANHTEAGNVSNAK